MKSILLPVSLLCALLPVAHGEDLTSLENELGALRARVEKIEQWLGSYRPGLSNPPSDREAQTTETDQLSSLAEAGKNKFNTFCTACHKDEFTNPMLAPPIFQAKDHYIQMYGDDKAAFVDAIVNWVKEPSPDKTLMPGAIRNFNIMPPFPLPDPDLKAIATYLFEATIAQPRGFEQHLQQERSQLGQEMGTGGQGQSGPGFGRGGPGQSGQGFNQGTGQGSAGHVPPSQPVAAVSELAIQGKAKFELFCMICHKYDKEDPMLAPPIFAVADHYKQSFGEDKEAFVKAITEWAKWPSEEKTLMPGAIAQFKLMPPFPIPDPDLEAVATFLFETDFIIPDWYDQHFLDEHGQPR